MKAKCGYTHETEKYRFKRKKLIKMGGLRCNKTTGWYLSSTARIFKRKKRLKT